MPELHFKGKEFVYNHHLSVPYRPLVIDNDKSVGATHDLNNNLIIHGDNLHALKALMPLYAGKVDCIFIDPPYNTGNEGWSYNDNVNSPMLNEWLASNPVGIEDGLRHDKWLAMMYPRIKLLHELMSDTGSFWMTLDDNEAHRARAILDEIFGEDNFLGTVIWEKADSPRMDADFFSTSHDYLIAYAKDKQLVSFHRLDEDSSDAPDHYKMEDDEGRKYYLKPLRSMGGQGETRESRPNLYYGLDAPDGSVVYPKLQNGKDGAWRWSSKKAALEASRIEWREGKAGWTPYFRIYADSGVGRPPETIFYNSDVGSSRTAKSQIKTLFSGTASFETPKPIGLLERVLEIATNKDSIILDSFAGSGTTAHAVLKANKNDDGNRRFVLVEGMEYADTITAERMRRVINGYEYVGTLREELHREKLSFTSLKNANKLLEHINSIENLEKHRFDAIKKVVKDGELIVTGEKNITEKVEGLGGSFTYCTLGEPIDLDGILTGQNLPSYEAIGSWLFHTATGDALDASRIDKANWYLGETSAFYVWLIYKPELEFLKSRDSALTLNLAENIAKAKQGKKHLVFAPAKFVPNKTLLPLGVEYAPLPFSLYKLER
jgi:adenine-specific DNA-methyltransferase